MFLISSLTVLIVFLFSPIENPVNAIPLLPTTIELAFKDLAVGVGESISVHLPTRELIGTFKGISEEGALLLKTGKTVHSITVGDVFLI